MLKQQNDTVFNRLRLAGLLLIIFLFIYFLLDAGMIMNNKGWDGDNRDLVINFIRNLPEKEDWRPVAIFDWDNTVIWNDIGDYFFFWMLDNGLFRIDDWEETSPYLTENAVTELQINCTLEKMSVTGKNKCRSIMTSIYSQGKLPDGSDAFSGYDPDLYEPSYAWLAHLSAGYKVDEFRVLCESAVKKALKEQKIKIYPQMKWLIGELWKKNVDVRVISASPQILVQEFAKKIGIEEDKVIGVRNVIEDGIIQADLEGCGPFTDEKSKMMTYRLGKRCWMNEVIFNVSGEEALKQQKDLSKRPVFGAGDSDTDLHYMTDVTGLRLLINRNKPEITKLAKENRDGRWLINSKFF